MKKIVLYMKMDFPTDIDKQRALKAISSFEGFELLNWTPNKKKMVVFGHMDPVRVIAKLRKKYPTDVLYIGDAEGPAPTPNPTYVHHYPYNYILTQYSVNGIRGRFFLNKFFLIFSSSVSAAVANANLQNQAPLSLHHRPVTSFPKSLAKIVHKGKRGYFMEMLKTLSRTSATQLFQYIVRSGAIMPCPAQLASTSLTQPQHNLDGASSVCSLHKYTLPRTEAMFNFVFTAQQFPQKPSMEFFSFS